MAQTGSVNSPAGLPDLPSTDSKTRLPDLNQPAPSPDFSGIAPPEGSTPAPPVILPRPSQPEKAKDEEWLAAGLKQKQEEVRKKEQEQAALAEQKAREARATTDSEKQEKEKKAKAAAQPTVSQPVTPGLDQPDAQKLPVVTGLDGVKPRAMASGDGRVQPGFDSFTGPSGTGPLGKDFQSGARPIMPGTTTSDGRMQVPSQAPEVPSGGYKRISQDPNTFPPGYTEKKPVAAPPPKPVSVPPNPATGDPKRVIDNTKAGFSPYDNTRLVPDPRSQRRF